MNIGYKNAVSKDTSFHSSTNNNGKNRPTFYVHIDLMMTNAFLIDYNLECQILDFHCNFYLLSLSEIIFTPPQLIHTHMDHKMKN